MKAVLENPGRKGKAAAEAQKGTSKQMPAPFLSRILKQTRQKA